MYVTSAPIKAMLRCAMAAPALLLADAVMAQEGEPALQEVIVTAQKKEESLQDAPVAVTVLQNDQIESFGVNNPNDLQAQMPGVQFMSSGLTNTTIRGVGTYNNQPNVDAAVAWNIDGTYISHHMATPPILFDLERIEVVRGPLGTLYGRNSNGGAINVITGRPVIGEWHGRVSVGAGNHDQRDTEVMLNAPLGEKLAIRASFASDYSEGYYEDGGEGTDNYAARVRLLYEASDRFNAIATVEWSDVDGSGVGLSYCPPWAAIQRPLCQGVAWKPYQGFGFPGNFNTFGTNGPIGENPGWTARENWSAYVELNYSWDAATLTSISNWHKYDRAELHVWDFNSYFPVHENSFITQEFRLTSAENARLDWVVGLFYSDEKSDGVEQFGTLAPPDLQTFVPVSSYGVEDGKVTSSAVFGELTYPLSDRFRLRGGLRFTSEKKELPGSARARLNTPTPVIVPTGDTLDTDKITWLAGAEFDLTEDSILYAKVNTGFKSGTVNAVPQGIGVTTTTTPEEITAYQVGSKNRFLNNRVQVNAELFHYDYDGYQVVVNQVDPTGFFPGVFFPSANAQKATFTGGEIESNFLVMDHGQLDLSLTLLDAKHDEFVTPAFDFSGNDVQRAPDFTVLAGYSHEFALPNGGALIGRLTSMYVDGNYTRDANVPGDFQDSYTNTSAYLTYRHSGERLSVTGWVRNLEDDEVMGVSMGTVARNGWNVFMLPPRMYGLTLKYEM
jgi:iron complex outermembrane recepter protein